MVANSDLQIWQTTVTGINASGKTDLIGEEWSALTVLNGCLSSGNFSSDESRQSYQMLKNCLSRHANNPVLLMHLYNFIALCEKYFMTQAAMPIGGIGTRQTKKSGANPLWTIMIVAGILGIGYYMVKDSDWFNNLVSRGERETKQVEEIAKITEKGTLSINESEQTASMIAVTTDTGVVINRVHWATRNVDAPGTFTTNPEDAGMLFQWNRKIGWSASDPLINSHGGTTWDSSMPTGTEWERSNDPSPAGWRVPTFDEINTLLDYDKVSNEWITVNGRSGRKFTDKTSGNSIFFPVAGWRDCNNGTLYYVDFGYYWNSLQLDSHRAWGFNSGSAGWWQAHHLSTGCLVRPIEILQSKTTTYSTSSSTPGRFPEASERLLMASDLQHLSKEELKIMRNEIFARHGYIFQTDEMKTYFQNQSWYLPQRSDVTAKLSNIETKNVNLIKSYENKTTDSASKRGTTPPIENTKNYANARVLLPKNWDGTFILANGMVWIWIDDIKLQKKYNVHPDYNLNNFPNDYATWDDDDTYYRYPLSPNVVIYAGIMSENCYPCSPRKMTVNEFATYMRKLDYAVEGNDDYGIVVNVTYNNGTITKITEVYTP